MILIIITFTFKNIRTVLCECCINAAVCLSGQQLLMLILMLLTVINVNINVALT